MRYLTKSRFKTAFECVTKLYYTGKKAEYADENLDDPFLRELARGGFQVGELAKFLFCDDPVKEKITIETLDYDEALKETQRRFDANKRTIIGEAAFQYKTLFVRTDIVIKDGDRLDMYEVKAKSIGKDDEAFITRRGVSAKWAKYLYDIAFQKYVAANACRDRNMTISAHLVLVDMTSTATIAGLNQKFKIFNSSNGKPRVEIEHGLRKGALGNQILRIINVDNEIEKIWNELPVPTDGVALMKFEEFVHLCADVYSKDERIFTSVGSRCKKCQFVNSTAESKGLKDGRYECWKKSTNYSDELLKKDLVFELSAVGTRDLADQLVMKGKFLVESVEEDEIKPKTKSKAIGLSSHQRRMEQIQRAKKGTMDCYFDKEGLASAMANWVYPLHMIDFETTMTALPFHKGRRPYEGIAFQFSHHTIDQNGTVLHAGQYLSFTPGMFPNYDLARELKKQLETDRGSIFRYHNHENTYLRFIHKQLDEDTNPPADKIELQSFIDAITTVDGVGGERAMIDLFRLVIAYYYSPIAKGSNSIKKILPAIIHDSTLVREKYSRSIYGKGKEIKSLNFDNHVWIDEKFGNDPYKTLPRLFEEYETEALDRMVEEFDELADGGAAMTAYNILQFSEIPPDQRRKLEEGLLRYCELDTMAMVMIVEGWKHLASR